MIRANRTIFISRKHFCSICCDICTKHCVNIKIYILKCVVSIRVVHFCLIKQWEIKWNITIRYQNVSRMLFSFVLSSGLFISLFHCHQWIGWIFQSFDLTLDFLCGFHCGPIESLKSILVSRVSYFSHWLLCACFIWSFLQGEHTIDSQLLAFIVRI